MFVMALTLAAVDLPSPPHPVQPMQVEVVRDPITDEVRATATLRDSGNRLVVSCEPSRYRGARVAVHSRRWLERGNVWTGHHPITWRFDNRPPRRSMWEIDDRRALLDGESRAWNFVSNLLSAERLVVRTDDVEDHRFDMRFRLVGVRPAVEWALAVCADAARRR